MLTVKELREALEGVPDHLQVLIRVPEADMLDPTGADEVKNEFNRIVIESR